MVRLVQTNNECYMFGQLLGLVGYVLGFSIDNWVHFGLQYRYFTSGCVFLMGSDEE